MHLGPATIRRASAIAALAMLLGLSWGSAPSDVLATNVPTVVAKIGVGTSPQAIAVNPVTNRIYVANEDSDNVSVIDGATATVMATITVGDQPAGVGVNTTTNRIFVSNQTGGTVSVIDGAANTVITTIPVSPSPGHIDVNNLTNTVYVGSAGSTLTVINGVTNTVSTTVTVGMEPFYGIGVNTATNRVFVANSNSDNISVIDGATNTEIDTDGNGGNGTTRIAMGHDPVGLAVDSTTNRVYVSIWNSFSGTSVTVIDGGTYAILANAPVASGPFDVDVHPGIDRAYAASDGSPGNVSVIDTNTNLRLATIPIAGGLNIRGIAVNTATNKIYVAVLTTGQVWVLSDPAPPLGSSLVNFQGRLTDSSGNPVTDGNYSIAFRIYDALSGGSQKWFETQTVAVSGSVFSVLLGSVNPLEAVHFSGEPRYLEVQVGADPHDRSLLCRARSSPSRSPTSAMSAPTRRTSRPSTWRRRRARAASILRTDITESVELPGDASSRPVAQGARRHRPRRHRHPRADQPDPHQGHAERGDRARARRQVRSRCAEEGSARVAGPGRHGSGADGDDRASASPGTRRRGNGARATAASTIRNSTWSRSTTASSATSCGCSPPTAAR